RLFKRLASSFVAAVSAFFFKKGAFFGVFFFSFLNCFFFLGVKNRSFRPFLLAFLPLRPPTPPFPEKILPSLSAPPTPLLHLHPRCSPTPCRRRGRSGSRPRHFL